MAKIDAARTNIGESAFTDPELHFSLRVPAGWIAGSSGQQGTRVILFAPQDAGAFRANVNVVVHALTAMTGDEYLALSRLQIKALTGRAAPEVDEPAGDRAGRLLEWHGWIGPMHVKTRQRICIAGASAFLVTATAPYERFAEHRADFAAALDSFQLDR